MYSDYLTKVALKKQNASAANSNQTNMDVDMQTDEQKEKMLKEYESERTNEEKSKSMKTGENYIIRKLISFKINIPKIDDYLQKLNSLEVKHDANKVGQYSTNTSNASTLGNVLNNYYHPMSATPGVTGNNNQFFNQFQNNEVYANQFKTLHGFNYDSQIAYQSQNFMFQPPMGQQNPFMNFNNNLVAGMQNMNLNNNNLF